MYIYIYKQKKKACGKDYYFVHKPPGLTIALIHANFKMFQVH